ncbi:MAG: TDP-N-acetylfucosamine:lipid II N-acetylfucosaminyltransferase [Rhodoferax sp.]|nr:TDP-N-acetylfucosamine:lipid II N-acetylfucosaminyltransferase [Rhodoferax sp.]
MKILHIGSAGAIMIPFVKFVNQNFNPENHVFMLSPEKGHAMPEEKNVVDLGKIPRVLRYFSRLWAVYRAEKVILHGLFDPRWIFLLMLQPWLLGKCYWVIWGGDLYDHQLGEKNFKWKLREFFKQRTFRKIGHFITHVRGDYELAQQWYGVKGQWHECFMYPSNLYREYPITAKPHEGINILLGNSASSSNNHLDALEKLRPFAGENIRIYCPLSYGDPAYGDKIAEAGRIIFGDKFIPLREFMQFEKYLQFLADIDIAIFNHNRQQGMGNVTTLLGLGKVVYMRSNITSYQAFKRLGIRVRDIDKFTITENNTAEDIFKVADYFSPSRLKIQWSSIFN